MVGTVQFITAVSTISVAEVVTTRDCRDTLLAIRTGKLGIVTFDDTEV